MKQQPMGGMRALTPFLFAAILLFAGTTTASCVRQTRPAPQASESALDGSPSLDAMDIQVKNAAGDTDIEELLFAAPNGETPAPKSFILKWLPASLPVHFNTMRGDCFGFPVNGQLLGSGTEIITVTPSNPSHTAGVHLSKNNPIADIPALNATISYAQIVEGQTHNTREIKLKQQVWSAYLLQGEGLSGSEVSSLAPFQDETRTVSAEQTISVVAPEGASVLWSGIRESYHINLRSVDGTIRVYTIQPISTLAKDAPDALTTAECQVTYEGKSISRQLTLTQRSEPTPALHHPALAEVYLMDGSTGTLTLRATTPVNTTLYLTTDDNHETAAIAHLPATVQMTNGTADIEITTNNYIATREILQKEVTLSITDTPNGAPLVNGTATLHFATPEAEANQYTISPNNTSDIYIPISDDMPVSRLVSDVVWRDNSALNLSTAVVGNHLRIVLNQTDQQGRAVVGVKAEGTSGDYVRLWKIDVTEKKPPLADANNLDKAEVGTVSEVQPLPTPVWSPLFAFGNNLLLDATGSPNLTLEYRTGISSTLHLALSYHPLAIPSTSEMVRFKHIFVQPEYRRWVETPFSGHFFGLHAHYAYFNVGGIGSRWLKEHRVQGNLLGTGFSYGYQFNLLPRLNLETSLGLGYTYLDYNIYEKGTNGPLLRDEARSYIGLTQIGIAVSYVM